MIAAALGAALGEQGHPPLVGQCVIRRPGQPQPIPLEET